MDLEETLLRIPVKDIITYGGVLDRYFSGLSTDRSLDPMHYGLQIIKEEGLPRDFRTDYQQMVLRTSRARNIMKFYEEKFGIYENGVFVDSVGLHKEIFRRKLKSARARSYGISIGFKKIWRDKGSLGFVKLQRYDDLDRDWSWIRKNLERGKTMSSHGLVFFVKKELMPYWLLGVQMESRREDPKLDNLARFRMSTMDFEEKREIETVDHELRHVIENIMGTKEYGGLNLEEIKASLVTSAGINGVKRDSENLIGTKDRLIEEMTETIKTLKLNTSSGRRNPIFTKIYERAIRRKKELEEQRSTIEETYSEFEEHIGNIPEEHWRSLSYVFSFTPEAIILEQLRRIRGNFN